MKLHMSKNTMNDDMLDYFTNHELPKPSSLKVEQMLKKKNLKKERSVLKLEKRIFSKTITEA